MNPHLNCIDYPSYRISSLKNSSFHFAPKLTEPLGEPLWLVVVLHGDGAGVQEDQHDHKPEPGRRLEIGSKCLKLNWDSVQILAINWALQCTGRPTFKSYLHLLSQLSEQISLFLHPPCSTCVSWSALASPSSTLLYSGPPMKAVRYSLVR